MGNRQVMWLDSYKQTQEVKALNRMMISSFYRWSPLVLEMRWRIWFSENISFFWLWKYDRILSSTIASNDTLFSTCIHGGHLVTCRLLDIISTEMNAVALNTNEVQSVCVNHFSYHYCSFFETFMFCSKFTLLWDLRKKLQCILDSPNLETWFWNGWGSRNQI